jgi:hypothetical protein
VLSWSGGFVGRFLIAAVAALAVAGPAGAATNPVLEIPQPAPPFVARAPLPPPNVNARPASDAAAISRGLRSAVAAGRLSRAEANEYRATVGRARAAIGRLPSSRATVIGRVLGLVRRQAGAFNRPRALALFSMLEQNTTYLSRRGLPGNETDVVGKYGIVYRVGWGYGLQFHPLANVIALNAHLYANRRQRALQLASALAARAVPRRDGAVWEYYFPYAGGAPPWASGMAQAIGAQALARVARRLTAPDFFGAARQAARSIPGQLTTSVSTGPWVKLYSFSGLVVLNAQLQASLSLVDYGQITDDVEAIGLGDRMEDAARNLMGRFDTGHWTNYSPGSEAPLKYHLYHVELARSLAQRTNATFWESAAARFNRYSHEPPVFRGGPTLGTIYPWPGDGFRDGTRVRFWVSKISTVSVRIGGRTYSFGMSRRGWYAFNWSPGRLRAGVYRPVATAVDLAGNRGTARLRGVRVAVDKTPPAVTTSVEGRRLTWRARDNATPWVRLTVRMVRGEEARVAALGRRPLSGSLRLPVPAGRWDTTLVVADSSRNRTRVALGILPTSG